MYDTVQQVGHPLSHDMPCGQCGHAAHTFLACSDSCECVPSTPVRYAVSSELATELVGA